MCIMDGSAVRSLLASVTTARCMTLINRTSDSGRRLRMKKWADGGGCATDGLETFCTLDVLPTVSPLKT